MTQQAQGVVAAIHVRVDAVPPVEEGRDSFGGRYVEAGQTRLYLHRDPAVIASRAREKAAELYALSDYLLGRPKSE